MANYAESLSIEGDLLLSGFYLEDLDLIKSTCAEHNLTFHVNFLRNNWVAAHFKKLI